MSNRTGYRQCSPINNEVNEIPKIKVFRFTYYDPEQGIQREGCGMCTKENIIKKRKNDPVKDHQIIESSGIEIDASELNETGRYYPDNETK